MMAAAWKVVLVVTAFASLVSANRLGLAESQGTGVRGDALDSEEYDYPSLEDQDLYQDDYLDEDYSLEDDWDEDEDEDEGGYVDENDLQDSEEESGETQVRVKRKITFGNGAYNSRRRGGGNGDPYRRRGNSENPYSTGDWPSRQYNGRRNTPMASPSIATKISTPAPPAPPTPAAESNRRPATAKTQSPNKSKTKRRETKKKPLSRTVRTQIAQYAVEHGSDRAAEHYRSVLGRRLNEAAIEKFVKRYQKKQQKTNKKQQQ